MNKKHLYIIIDREKLVSNVIQESTILLKKKKEREREIKKTQR